eukprot:219813-Pyramimonas_sp.AAC.1
MAASVCRAVDRLHTVGLGHFDLKGNNLKCHRPKGCCPACISEKRVCPPYPLWTPYGPPADRSVYRLYGALRCKYGPPAGLEDELARRLLGRGEN